MSAEELVDALFAAFAEADVGAVAALFHETARQRVFSATTRLPLGGIIAGRDALATHYRTLWRNWRVTKVETDAPVVDGNRVAVRALVDVEELSGQRRHRTEVMHFLVVDDGRIAEIDIFLEDAPAEMIHEPEPPDARDKASRPS